MDRFSEMQVFAKVVEDGGFSSAARALSLTPSGVSKLIARLEDRLGVLLLKRNSRSMTLTPEGEAYYQHTLNVLEAMDEAEASVADPARGGSGVLRVYTFLSFACHQIAPLMPEFRRRHPDLRVEFHTGSGLLRTLDSTMDLALYPFDMKDCSLVVRRIAQARWVICASPEYLKERGVPEHSGDLANHTCLNFAMDAPCNTWSIWDESEERINRVQVKAAAAATDAEMLLAMARAGVGIMRGTEYQVAQDLAEGRLVALFQNEGEAPKQSIYAIYQSRRHLASRVRVFLDYLEESFGRQRDNWAVEAPAPQVRQPALIRASA